MNPTPEQRSNELLRSVAIGAAVMIVLGIIVAANSSDDGGTTYTTSDDTVNLGAAWAGGSLIGSGILFLVLCALTRAIVTAIFGAAKAKGDQAS
ncbi:hypothetical protein [Streptomyces sp. TRM64462]|uniref:hypothetical protein n=1 Tax=Streptomyces sp. TRM64462 TaxID=2741726 RepID=UPI001586567C|nr:hypothetical protein [Streptomyces sp. TRM64462]